MMKLKAMGAFIMLIIAVLAFCGVAQAEYYDDSSEINFTRSDEPDLRNVGDPTGIDVMWVKVNGDIYETGDTIREQLLRGDELEVKVKLQSNVDMKNVEVEAEITGDEHYDIEQTSETFDVKAGVRYTKTLTLRLPDLMDQDSYDLRVSVHGRTGRDEVYNYKLLIEAPRHSVIIKEVSFSPDDTVRAGTGLLVNVKVRNIGVKDEDEVDVRVSIPALSIYPLPDSIHDLESDDTETSEDLWIDIPPCTEAGQYKAVVSVEFDDGFDEVSEEHMITVLENDLVCAIDKPDDDDDDDDDTGDVLGKTLITVGPESQEVVRGEGGAIFPLSLTNDGTAAKSYTIAVTGTEGWATVKVSPSNLVTLQGGETKNVYVYVSANEQASEGAHVFSLEIRSGDETLKQIPLSANVLLPEESTGKWDKVKKGLEVALVILVVLLIIIGLVIGFTKMKKSEEDDELSDEEDLSSSQTYY
ncbi:hypothetical protein KY339_03105 [Candidatus Woesearchaeota archaeon]|nr:hypothetical protein [Candidatus Woesearchaeota archaeon]